MDIKYWVLILEFFVNYTSSVSIILFLHCFYDIGFVLDSKKSILFIILAFINFISNLLNVPYIDDICSILYILASVYDYKGKKIVGFSRYASIYFLVVFLVSSIFIYQMSYIVPDFQPENLYVNQRYELAMAIWLAFFFGLMLFLLYFCVYKKGIVIKCGKRENLLLYVYLLILSLMAGCVYVEGIGSYISTTMTGYFLSIISTMPPIFIFSACINSHYHKRTKMQEIYLQSELDHFRQYMHAQEETRRFRHDIRNNLLCMNEMVSSGDKEKLAQYLEDLLEITDSLSFKYVTGDVLLDSILNSKAQDMERQNISFQLDGVLPGGLSWKPMDICAVFANAMDNAIEACQKVDSGSRYISMIIKSTPQFWLITIENSVAQAVDVKKLFHKDTGYTSKADSSRHGIGTYSMKQTAESYGAIMKAECTDQAFKLEIIIDKK